MTDSLDTINFSSKLIDIGNGIEADHDVQASLLNCTVTGLEILKEFMSKRFDLNVENEASFYDTTQRSKLK